MVRSTIHGTILLAAGIVVGGCAVNEPDLRRHPIHAGQTPPAPSELTSSIPSSDSSLRSLVALARLSERRGQTDQASRLYNVVIEREPRNPVPHHRLGVMYAKEGRFQDSDRHFTKAIELDPSNPRLLSDIGYSCYLQHRLPEAEEMLRRASAIPNDDPAISNNLGLLLGEQGRYDECMAAFKRTGDDARAHANLAFVHAQRGDLEEAKANYSRALTLNEDLRPAAQAMVQLAQHERIHRRPPPFPRTPQPDARQAPELVRLPPPQASPVPMPPRQVAPPLAAASPAGPALAPPQPRDARPINLANQQLPPMPAAGVQPASYDAIR